MLLTNTGTDNLSTMRKWAEVIMGGQTDYEGGANSRNPIGAAVYDTGAPAQAHLHYHHEMAYVNQTVTNLAFLAKEATEGKGYMYVSNNDMATEEIMRHELGKKLRDKGICYVRCLTDKKAFENKPKTWNGYDEEGVYNHWQTSFGTDCPEKVEELAIKLGLNCVWGANRYLKTKYYTSAFEQCPFTGRNVLFSSVADDSMWFDTWPGVAHLPCMDDVKAATENERPLKLTYGDDTDLTREELYQYMSAYDFGGMPIKWKKGDVLVMCNIRWAHGRPAYSLNDGEQRKLGVVLGKKVNRVGQDDSKWED